MQYVIRNVISWSYKVSILIFLLFSGLTYANDQESKQVYMVVDSFGKHYFSEPPKRVVVTDWTLLEQLLDLGIIPVGAPEIEQYKAFSPFTDFPKSIKNIGSRQSPSPKIISALNPDIIILGTDQKKLARPLSRITKVLYYQNFSPRFKSNGETAIKRNRQLAEVFKQQPLSDKLVEKLTNTINIQKNKLLRYFSNQMPKVIIVRVFSKEKIIAYSPHSIIGWTVENLGLHNVLNSNKTKFGEQSITLHEITQLSADFLLCSGLCTDAVFNLDDYNSELIRLDESWPYGSLSTMQSIAINVTEKILAR